jgi:hypothetical protein
MRTLLLSASFWAPANRGTLVKSPLDYTAGLLKQFDVTLDGRRGRKLAWFMGETGTPPFDPPNPARYRTGLRLTGASMLLMRCQFADHLLRTWAPDAAFDRLLASLPTAVDAESLVAVLAARMGIEASANTRDAAMSYLGTGLVGRDSPRERARETAYLLACSPEYQMY